MTDDWLREVDAMSTSVGTEPATGEQLEEGLRRIRAGLSAFHREMFDDLYPEIADKDPTP